ncbi:DUF885 family protein [Pelomonas sp. KK5]|uniref:DUF885 domain-containing protein n=1 Tax=Pelomonas sp. KK5 TaxID=1855730 RepID=UPI001301F63E|nr:DUF885 domain-containing protein [Pelomonas sp. KK5]
MIDLSRRAMLALAMTLSFSGIARGVPDESAKANAFFDRVFDEDVARSPMREAYLGIRKDMDRWDDFSEQRELDDLGRSVRSLAELRRGIAFERLDEQTKLSYRLFVSRAEQEIEGYRWRHHGYVFTQMYGLHQDAPAFLINFHPVASEADARAYIARLRGMPAMFAQLQQQSRAGQAIGVLPPKFVFPLLIDASRQVIRGEPFEGEGQSALWADFSAKVGALKTLDAAKKKALLAAGRAALLQSVQPAYERLIAMFEDQQRVATDDDGVWKLPDGAAYYAWRLRQSTTSRLGADEIHELGLAEVARIHREMAAIKERVGFQGDLKAFLAFMRDDPQFAYPQTDAGKAAYIERATQIIDDMRRRLPEFFGVLPKAPLVVKKVEPFREQGSAGAFYNAPTPDGSRPGTYYVNTVDMRGLPIWEMETLAHHEAIPGHHMQIAIAQELKGIPKFRRFGGYTAYVEGWALYAEAFPKDFGFYADPYQDFGRLSDELLRAVRLVVDTGQHARHWTREQVLAYMQGNTAGSERDNFTESNRYVVWPGQATGYKVGMLKLMELRERARGKLGAKFQLRDFHDLVLKNGALPLDLLEQVVDEWIARQEGK